MRRLFGLVIFLLLLVPNFAFAQTSSAPKTTNNATVGAQYADIQDQGIIFANICTSSSAPCACRDAGICELEDILQVIANVMVFILAISGSIFVLIFLSGGILWITSNGRPERIQNGKLTMVRAVVGLIIIFASYAVVALIIGILINGQAPSSTDTIEDIIGNDANTVIQTTTN